jgi:hypothetical protein
MVRTAKDDGDSRFEYDLPSSLFGQFGDDRINEVARGLDVGFMPSSDGARGLLR